MYFRESLPVGIVNVEVQHTFYRIAIAEFAVPLAVFGDVPERGEHSVDRRGRVAASIALSLFLGPVDGLSLRSGSMSSLLSTSARLLGNVRNILRSLRLDLLQIHFYDSRNEESTSREIRNL